jgi:hypothetical protein
MGLLKRDSPTHSNQWCQGLWLQKYIKTLLPWALGGKPHFSTMFSITSQLSFIVENITFNCKMSFAIQKWHCELISKIVDNVESTLQHSWKQRTRVNLWVTVEVTTL